MIQASKPNAAPQQRNNQPPGPPPTLTPPDPKPGTSITKTRRGVFRRMLILPLLLALLLIVGVIISQDLHRRKSYRLTIQHLHQKIETYVAANNRLPTHDDLNELDWTASPLPFKIIRYDNTKISLNLPPDTILAHTGLVPSRILKTGHVVLYLNDQIKWLSPQEFQQEWDRHQRQINRQALPQ